MSSKGIKKSEEKGRRKEEREVGIRIKKCEQDEKKKIGKVYTVYTRLL